MIALARLNSYLDLCGKAKASGWHVLLETELPRDVLYGRSRLSRLVVSGADKVELVAVPIRDGNILVAASHALAFLRNQREAA